MSLVETENYSFNLIKFAKLAWSWKLPLVVISCASLILTYVFTGPTFIEPKYKASVIFYPTSNVNMGSTMLTEPGTQGYSVTEFGSDQDAEQLLQILNSDEIKNKVIIKFELGFHYGFDTTKSVSMLSLRSLFNKNYIVKQTEYKAIQIIVFDGDPQRAADIANFVALIADQQKSEIQRAKAKQAYEIVKKEYELQSKRMDTMTNILTKLREKGVYDYFGQSQQLNEVLTINTIRLRQEAAMLEVYEDNKDNLPDTLLVKTRARIKGYQAAIKSIEPMLNEIKNHGGEYLNNINNLELERKKLLSLKGRYESSKIDYEQALPQKFVINAAEKPEIPSSPRRLLSSAIAAFVTFIFSLLIIGLMQAWPSIRASFKD